ncbi:MAG: GNAT family N-acetyltransferase [Hyphomicrobiales bacterium]
MISKAHDTIAISPLTSERWADLEDLFGPERGANSGCWCMWPRIARADYDAMPKADRKLAFRSIVRHGPAPGLLAYEHGQAIGWCAVGPRASFARFNSAKPSRPIESGDGPDAKLIYAITCFFVRNGHRRLGLTRRLAGAAVEFARMNGADAIDVCAIDADRPLIWGDGFVGISSVFASLGFREIARRSPRRPLMRLDLKA